MLQLKIKISIFGQRFLETANLSQIFPKYRQLFFYTTEPFNNISGKTLSKWGKKLLNKL